jgi:hypothetical protein
MSDSSRLAFDLREAQRGQNRIVLPARVMALCGATLLVLLDVRDLTAGLLPLVDAPRLALIITTLAFAVLLVWAAIVWFAPGPTRLEMDALSIRFIFPSGLVNLYRWDDPALDVSLLDFTSTPWDRAGTPRPVSMYFLGTRRWKSYALTSDAGTAILREARVRNLSLSPAVGSGTLFRREYGQRQTHIRGSAAALAHRN